MSEYQTCDLLIEAIDEESGGPLTKEGVELVRRGWERGQAAMQMETTTLLQQLEQAQARNKELAESCVNLSCWLIAAAETEGPIKALILRKQAEAVEFLLDKLVEDQPCVSANVTGVINYYAQRLRQQAQEPQKELKQ